MARLPLFYDSQFIGNTPVGGPGSTTGAADGPVLGTGHASADLDGNMWQTQGANYLGGATLETLNQHASTPFGGALSRPAGERCRDQMVRFSIIPGLTTVWMIYFRFNTAGAVTYYRFRLRSDGILYADAVQAPGQRSGHQSPVLPDYCDGHLLIACRRGGRLRPGREFQSAWWAIREDSALRRNRAVASYL